MSTDIDNIKSFDLKSFLKNSKDFSIFNLKKEFGSLGALLAEQIEIYKKASLKLPVFADKYCFFTKKSYEQSSSQRTALFKSSLFSGKNLLDLTGGLGADDWAFSKSYRKVISVEKNESLNELVRINFEKLGLKNVERIDADAYDFIQTDGVYDMVYVDADRRSDLKRSITLNDSEPNVLKILPRLFELSQEVMLKLSPLTDITYILKSLPFIKDIYIVSLNNEVKDVLVLLHKDRLEKSGIYAVELSGTDKVRLYSSSGDIQEKVSISETGKYFFEPGAAIIKAGLVNEYAAINGLNAVTKNSLFFTGNVEIKDFIGRQFMIINQMPFGKSQLKKYLKEYNIAKANISCRSFPVDEEEIKKTFSLKDGGEDYLFFTSGTERKKLFYHCRKLAHVSY